MKDIRMKTYIVKNIKSKKVRARCKDLLDAVMMIKCAYYACPSNNYEVKRRYFLN